MRETVVLDAVVRDRLIEAHPSVGRRLVEDTSFASALATVTRASRSLTRLVLTDADALDALGDLDRREPLAVSSPDDLVRWKRRELLRLAARDMTGLDPFEAVGAGLADLAEDVLGAALQLADAEAEIVVVGMGKLGGCELNYASDIDVLFVGSPGAQHKAQHVLDIARRCFRVDANLRPEGRDGPLVRSLDAYETYWQTWAQSWEFQALLKARPLGTSATLGRAWAEAAEVALWNRPFGAEDLRAVREMKTRTEAVVRQSKGGDREIKRGAGGIRDIEFSVQLLQLVHGGADDRVRSPTTLDALRQLAEGGYVAEDDTVALAEAYRFLRQTEHCLQLVEEEQTHSLPAGRAEREQLARVMGTSLESFDETMRRHRATVRHAHEQLYFRPLLEAFAGDGRLAVGGVLEARLAAFGFTDAERTRQAVLELTRGLGRSSRLMSQLMPLLLDWLSATPDPDEGLLGLRGLLGGDRVPAGLLSRFRDSPESARRLCVLVGTGRRFARGLELHPELTVEIGEDRALVPHTPPAERLSAALDWRVDLPVEERQHAVLRLAQREQLRIAAADVLGLVDGDSAAQLRTALAEAVLRLALAVATEGVDAPIGLIAMGRFGGQELSYASDLDVVVVHGGTTSAEQNVAESVAQRLLKLIADPTPGRSLYRLDYDLRPEGRKGVITRSLDGCRQYYESWAQPWERQALVRARPVAGPPEVTQCFLEIVRPFVWGNPLSPNDLREMRGLKARMERERIPRREDPQFHLKLGPGSLSDVEWTVQLLQLQRGVQATGTMAALSTLLASDAVSPTDSEVLAESWRFCDLVRNRWWIIDGDVPDSLPTNAFGLARLARSMGTTPVELRERYRLVTRRARAVTERLFYGYP